MSLKLISRVALLHDNKILLVKNADRDFWSLPGGHCEWEIESLKECACRELLEETGIKANISKILFVQEFNSKNNKIIEIIWLATPKDHLDNILEIKQTDTDPESEIEQVKWFDFTDLNKIEVKPNQLLELIKNQEITYIKS